jgi:hypothetical protein
LLAGVRFGSIATGIITSWLTGFFDSWSSPKSKSYRSVAALAVSALTSALNKAQMTGTMNSARQLYLAQFQMSNDGNSDGRRQFSVAWRSVRWWLPWSGSNARGLCKRITRKRIFKGR